MATKNDKHDPLRNPQVDYDRSDLSAKGILYFLIGLFIAGVFIELVIWGMFRFMARSEALFPQPPVNPMMSAQQKVAPPGSPRSVMQNTPAANLGLFPEPRLQVNDAGDMEKFFDSEQKLLDPEHPFTDPSGAVHIPITLAMKLIEERGLPVRPNAPLPDAGSEGTSSMPDAPGNASGDAPPPRTSRVEATPAGEQKQP
jgi:hypothetical protein